MRRRQTPAISFEDYMRACESMTPPPEGAYGIDLVSAFKRLWVAARLMNLRMPDVFDGMSAEDLPSEVLTQFLESPDGLGWDPQKGDINRFLLVVMRNKAIDRLRRHARTAGSFDDPTFAMTMNGIESDPNAAIEANEWMQRIREIAKGDTKLLELLSRINEVGDGQNVNQCLANDLHTTTRDIENRKKRFKRKILAVIAAIGHEK
jgi:sigma-70-like protein